MWAEVRYRLRALLRRTAMERELAEEMAHHAAVTGTERGMEQAKEACREARGVRALETTWRDLRLGGRSLRQAPGFTLPAALTLALGLGAAMAIFAVANGVLWQPLAYRDSSHILLLRERVAMLSPAPVEVSAPDIPWLRAGGKDFESVGVYRGEQLDLAGAGEPVRLWAARVTPDLFPLLGAAPRLGRNFTAAEDRPGEHVMLISDGLWHARLGADPHAAGRVLRLNGQPYTVVGVMPPGFEFPPRGLPRQHPAEVWVPMALTSAERTDVADDFDFGVLARLRPQASLSAARAQMALAAARIQAMWEEKIGPVAGLQVEVVADPLRAVVVASSRRLMLLLLAAAGLLLLLSWANAGNLFLVRATRRRHEMALRAALGASRARLLRQAATEAMLLGLLGGGVGLLLALGALAGLTALAPLSLPQVLAIHLGAGAVLAGLGLALAAGLACGLLPALAASQGEAAAVLQASGTRTTQTRREARWQAGLVVAQVGIAFVLGCGAGLLVRSLAAAEAGGGGLEAQPVLTAALALPQAEYPTGSQDLAFYQRLAGALGALPGVVQVGAASDLPTESNWDHAFTVEHSAAPPAAKLPDTAHSLVLGGYFAAMGIPLLQGRGFNARERAGGAHVIIVSAALAARFWPRGQAVGQRLKWGDRASHSNWLTVVGVAGDVHSAALDEPAGLHTYEPYQQICGAINLCRNLNLVVRSALPLAQLAAQVRTAVQREDGQVPVTELRPLAAVLAASLTPRRFNTVLIATFGGAALLLAAVGLYGVLAFVVNGQRREIGVRMALGARPGEVAAQVLGRGARLAVAGLGLGAAGAWLLRGLVASLLYQTSAADPATWAGVALLLLAVALAACALPARRAARVAPGVALREQ